MSPTTINILIIGGGVLFTVIVVIFGIISTLLTRDSMGDRLQQYAVVTQTAPQSSTKERRAEFTRIRLRVNNLLSLFVSQKLSSLLLSAHWPITEIEFVLIRLGSVILGFGIGALGFGSSLSGIGFAIIAFILPGVFLRWSINRRRRMFNKQLVDVLVLVEGGIRAGYSFLQAIDLVVSELPAPASEEFRRVKREVGLGLPMSDALINLTNRMENKDLNLVVTAININTQVGGNLSTMLNVVTETIRERSRLFSEVRALTAQQRYTGYLLTLLPFFIGAVLFILNPEYMGRLFEPELLYVPIGAVVSILIGNFVISQLVKVDL